VFAITKSILKEFRTFDGGISVLFQKETEEIKSIRENINKAALYMITEYEEIIQERIDALDQGAGEVIIVRSPVGFEEKFLTRAIYKNDYINQFNQLLTSIKEWSGFELFRPVNKLADDFEFSKGELIFECDWYLSDEEKESLMKEAENNGKSYAFKAIKRIDEIQKIDLSFENKIDKNKTVNIGVQQKYKSTYNLPDEVSSEIINRNGIEILAFTLKVDNVVYKNEYHLVKNDLFFSISTSENISKDEALRIIDAFLFAQEMQQ
jgi:hypothetical protein